MSIDLPALLRAGDVDRAISRAKRALNAAEQLAAPQRQRVEGVQAERERLNEQLKLGQREVARLEGEAKSKNAEIEKSQIAQNSAKNNDEYQALLRAIDKAQRELSDIETKILEAYEAQEKREKAQAECGTRLKALETDLAGAKQRVEAEEGRARAELTKLEAEREAALAALPSDLREVYLKQRELAGDNALASVVDECCQACYVRVRPDQYSQVRGGQTLVVCHSCGAILYEQP